jgi:D-alanyl-D-alanine carboxypeptidase (penicillin-binding protein 5/6)
MKKLIHSAIVAALVLPAFAHASFVPTAPEIAGKAYYLLDFQSGQLLATQNPDMRVEPASLTKLMTAYLTFKALKEHRLTLDQTLTVSTRGWKTSGSRMFLDPKKPAKVSDLIRGMIVQSGNDACVTLAEAIAGSEDNFAQLMTAQARTLGMQHTQFMNATGLPNPNHYTTVHDLAILSSAIIRDFPQFYPIYSIKSFSYNNITQPNRNLLLYRDPNVDGMKTGYTDNAGYNMIASSHRDGRRVLSVVVGTASPVARADESAKLLGYGLQFFESPKLYSANKVVGNDQVSGGAESSVAVGFTQDVYATVPKGDAARVKSELVMRPVTAPVAVGQVVGSANMTLDGKVINQQPLVALQPVQEGGFFSRIWSAIKHFLHL